MDNRIKQWVIRKHKKIINGLLEIQRIMVVILCPCKLMAFMYHLEPNRYQLLQN